MLSLPLLFFNSLRFLVVPFVVLVGLPLALCAGATSILAFLVLFLRLFLVYFEVGLETIRHMLFGHATHTGYSSSHSTPAVTPTFTQPQAATNSKRRNRIRRHGSSGLLGTGCALEKFSAIAPSIGLERDFEGLGGWRLDSTDGDTDNAEERQWFTVTSRPEDPYRRHHFRSQSGGAVLSGHTGSVSRPGPMTSSHSPDRTRRSPTGSRSNPRTPTMKPGQEFTKADQDYFYPR